MKRIILSIFAFVLAAFALAYGAPTYAQFANTENGPQTGLPKSVLTINTPRGVRRFNVELANTAASREIGMMWRTSVGHHEGMLFQFPVVARLAFWMKNTMIPLDIIYIRPDGTISQINANAQPFDLTPIPSREPISGVLEIAGGEAARQNIAEGQVVIHPFFHNVPPPIAKKKRH